MHRSFLMAGLVFALVLASPKARAVETLPDPATWGVYAQLLGKRWRPESDAPAHSFAWGKPGEEIVLTVEGSVLKPPRIVRGAQQGSLTYIDYATGLKTEYEGRVGADGSVVFTHGRLLQTSFRVRPLQDGGWVHEWVKLKDGQVVSVQEKYARRFSLVDVAASPALNSTGVAQAKNQGGTGSEQSRASGTPASAVTIATSETPLIEQAQRNFGPITRFAGQRLVGSENMLEIQLLAVDRLAIQFLRMDGSRRGRYVIRVSNKRPGQLELLETAMGEKNSRPHAWLEPNGTLIVDSQDGLIHGWRYLYEFRPATEGIVTVYNSEFKNQLRITIHSAGGDTDVRDLYQPLTQDRVAAALAGARHSAEMARIERENRRRDEAQRQANWNAALQGFTGGFAQGMAEANEAAYRQGQFLSELERDAAQIQRQKEADERRAAQIVAAAQSAFSDTSGASSEVSENKLDDEREHKEAQQVERERLTQQQAAEQARKQQQAEADRAAKEAERKRQEEQRKLVAEHARKQAEQNLVNSFRGRAATCVGGGKDIYYLQTSTPPKTGCNVSFEARCPGVADGAGVQFSQRNYIGGSCQGLGDNIRIGMMDCAADQVRIDLRTVSCG